MTSIFDLKDERMISVTKRIVAMREDGEGWTAIRDAILDEYGIGVHRSTIQRWYDSTGYLLNSEELDPSSAQDVSDDVVRDLKTYKKTSARDFYKHK